MDDLTRSFLMNTVLLVVLTIGLAVVKHYAKIKLQAIVNTYVQLAEAQIRGSKLGATKKEWVLEQLENIGIEANETISNLIDDLVDIMNKRKSSLLDVVTEEIKDVVSQ